MGTRALRLASLAVLPLLLVAGLLPATAQRPGTAQPFEIKLINGLGAGEPQIAVDPTHHSVAISFLLGNPPNGVSKCGVATSADRGKTWRVRFKNPADPAPKTVGSCSDPIAATGAHGAMYVGAEWTEPGTALGLDTYVSRSTDGGETWGPAVYATGFRDTVKNVLAAPNYGIDDRPWLVADSRTGTVYANMADFAPRLGHWIVASHDRGRTFGPPRALASHAAPEYWGGDYIPSAAFGVLAVSYVATGVDPDCLCRQVFETSRDDGVTWTRHAAPIPAQWTAADPSHPGRFAIMSGGEDISDWQSFNADNLLVSVTSDYGKTWSPPVRIGEDPPNPRWMPWLAYGPTGVLGLSYRTKYGTSSCLTPYDCTNTSYAEWAAISADGGFHFGPPVRISHAVSAAQIDNGTGFAAGDDFGTIALDDKYLYVAWGDMRKSPNSPASGAERSLYFGRIALPAGPKSRRH